MRQPRSRQTDKIQHNADLAKSDAVRLNPEAMQSDTEQPKPGAVKSDAVSFNLDVAKSGEIQHIQHADRHRERILAHIPGLYNARELGGLCGRDGRRVRRGCLIRAGSLTAIKPQALSELCTPHKLALLIDLRTEAECAAAPDPWTTQPRYVHNPILQSLGVGISPGGLRERLRRLRPFFGEVPQDTMCRLYEELVSETWCVAHFRRFFELLNESAGPAAPGGAVLFHCSQGKDRTGIAAALLLHALGVSREDIEADYLLTNECIAPRREKLRAQALAEGLSEAEAAYLLSLEAVEARYLSSAFDKITRLHGSVDNFLEQVLAVSIERLSARFLEPTAEA